MQFEFDPANSKANKVKHGIDFVDAQTLWQDEDAIMLPGTGYAEERFLVIGKIGERIWTAIITFREQNIRLISVRRSRENERLLYENQIGN